MRSASAVSLGESVLFFFYIIRYSKLRPTTHEEEEKEEENIADNLTEFRRVRCELDTGTWGHTNATAVVVAAVAAKESVVPMTAPASADDYKKRRGKTAGTSLH